MTGFLIEPDRPPAPRSKRERDDAPLFTECVIGFREWRLADWVLEPKSVGHPWRPGVNHARCHRETFEAPHSAPAQGCNCGLYALHKPPPNPPYRLGMTTVSMVDGASAPVTTIAGAVAAWGDLEVHNRGFRAASARIVALAWPEHDEPNVFADGLAFAARMYGVPVVPFDQLEAEALKHGRPLPPDVIPEALLSHEVWFGHYARQAPVEHNPATTVTFLPNTVSWIDQLDQPEPLPKGTRKRSNRQGPPRPKRPPKRIDAQGAR